MLNTVNKIPSTVTRTLTLILWSIQIPAFDRYDMWHQC